MTLQRFSFSDLKLSTVRAEVDLAAIRHNVRTLQRYAGAAEIMATIKADSYGHGAIEVARELAGAGIQFMAVATVSEALALRAAGIQQKLLVLGAPLPTMLSAYVAQDIRLTISSVEVAESVIAKAFEIGPFNVHIKVDTGMHRLGLHPREVPPTLDRLRAVPGIRVEGMWTHFATVDRSFALEQLKRFDELVASIQEPPPLRHVANGGTLLCIPETSQGRDYVRVGGPLFGLVVDRIDDAVLPELKPAMRLVSHVAHLQSVSAGETVSYGRTWTAGKNTRIATIPAGYGDGLPRSLSNRGSVGIRGKLCPIVGIVCMDMLMVDLGDDDWSRDVRVGEEVVLFGAGGPSVSDMAAAAGTIAYDLTCGLTARVSRVYLNGEA